MSKDTSDVFNRLEIYVPSLDAKAEYVSAFGMGSGSRHPDVSRGYRILTHQTEVDPDESCDMADLVLTMHHNRSGMEGGSRGEEHKCGSMCREVVPVIPVGWEELLEPVYHWWQWEATYHFINDGVIVDQPIFDILTELGMMNQDVELITTYEQILSLFPMKEIDGDVYLP